MPTISLSGFGGNGSVQSIGSDPNPPKRPHRLNQRLTVQKRWIPVAVPAPFISELMDKL